MITEGRGGPVSVQHAPRIRTVEVPNRSRFLCWGAERYLLRGFGFQKGFIARHFNAVRIAVDSPVAFNAAKPVVFYLNHPSWWDPLTAFLLARHLVPDRYPIAPIERTALARYPLLERMGLFGVDHSPAGVKTFLKTASAAATDPSTSLWFTPEGRFTDPRARPVRFEQGIGHLAKRLKGIFVPVAIDYRFWDERLPEILARLGAPIDTSESIGDASTWTDRCERELEAALDQLADDAERRDPSRFRTILSGSAGVSRGYDLLRRVKSAATGERFRARHSKGPAD